MYHFLSRCFPGPPLSTEIDSKYIDTVREYDNFWSGKIREISETHANRMRFVANVPQTLNTGMKVTRLLPDYQAFGKMQNMRKIIT